MLISAPSNTKDGEPAYTFRRSSLRCPANRKRYILRIPCPEIPRGTGESILAPDPQLARVRLCYAVEREQNYYPVGNLGRSCTGLPSCHAGGDIDNCRILRFSQGLNYRVPLTFSTSLMCPQMPDSRCRGLVACVTGSGNYRSGWITGLVSLPLQ